MFRKNEQHRQQSFFSSEQLLPAKLQERLLKSWAETFYQEVFCRLDEAIFAPLYSDEDSRPNTPVNVLVGAEILKSGFGWSDEELYEQVCFNLQVRHALGLHDLQGEVFTLRTLYNFRHRVLKYAQTTGVNLLQQVFEHITDKQLAVVGLATGWQRMDSTQVLSNLAQLKRLELLLAVLQAIYRRLPAEMQAQWGERWSAYLQERPHQICYKTPPAEMPGQLEAIGQELGAIEPELLRQAPEHAGLALVRRVLAEQYERGTDGPVRLRAPQAVRADSLQSPHDLEATYRVKGGKNYRGGYVAHVSETADPENPLQLITDVQVAPNRTDDAVLLAQSLDNQAARGIEVRKATTDGGYTGPRAEAACAQHQVELRPTRMRGGQSAPDKWGWEQYSWELNEEGGPLRVTCPQGCSAALQPSRAAGGFIAHFESASCAGCPHLGAACRVQARVRTGFNLYPKLRLIEVARQRQRLRPEDTAIRAVVESTVRSLKHAFPNNKLPVRGLIRSRMVLYGAALMVNLRRLHRYFTTKREAASEKAVFSLSLLQSAFCRYWRQIHRCFSRLRPILAHHVNAVAPV